MRVEGREYDTGIRRWRYGSPATYEDGRVLSSLLGPCPRCGYPTKEYGGGFSCRNSNCLNSAMLFTVHTADRWPDWWNEDIFVKLDGDSWFAYGPDFVDIQESTVGWGDTPNEAVECYRARLKEGK